MISEYNHLKSKIERYLEIIQTAKNDDISAFTTESLISALEEDKEMLLPLLDSLIEVAFRGTTAIFDNCRDVFRAASSSLTASNITSLLETNNFSEFAEATDEAGFVTWNCGNFENINEIYEFKFKNSSEALVEIEDLFDNNEKTKQQNFVAPLEKAKKVNNSLVAKKKFEHLTQVDFWPAFGFLRKLISLVLSPTWKVRLFAICLLSEALKQDAMTAIYTITCNASIKVTTIENKVWPGLSKFITEVVIIACLKDRIVDFNNQTSFCLFRDLAAQTVCYLPHFIDKTNELLQMLRHLLQNSDWESIYSVLLLLKYGVKNKKTTGAFIFEDFSSLIPLKSEEIVNITIEIAVYSLETRQTAKSEFRSFVLELIALFSFFDDINQGAVYYMESLLKTTAVVAEMFQNDEELKNILVTAIEANFAVFSIHLMTKVRQKFYTVLSKFMDQLVFSDAFLFDILTIAYQTICLEENKEVVKEAEKFIHKVNNLAQFATYLNENKIATKFVDLLVIFDVKKSNLIIPISLEKTAENPYSLYTLLISNSLDRNQENMFFYKLKHLLPLIAKILLASDAFSCFFFTYLAKGLPIIVNDNNLVIFAAYTYLLSAIESTKFIYPTEYLTALTDKDEFDKLPFYLAKTNEINILLDKLASICVPSDLLKKHIKQLDYNILSHKDLFILVDSLAVTEDAKRTARALKQTVEDKISQLGSKMTILRAFISISVSIQTTLENKTIDKFTNLLNSLIAASKLNANKHIIYHLTQLVAKMPPKSQEKAFILIINSLADNEQKNNGKSLTRLFSLFVAKEMDLVRESITKNYEKNYEKSLFITYCLAISKTEIKIDFDSFASAVISNLELNTITEKYTVDVMLRCEKVFGCCINYVLNFLFTSPVKQQHLVLLNILMKHEKFQLPTMPFIFKVLELINHHEEDTRHVATQIFSQMMKLVSMTKLSDYSNTISPQTKALIANIMNPDTLSTASLDEEIKSLNIKIPLREYQKIGIKWLKFLSSFGLSGCLCDDMGLGKTVQTLVAVITESFKNKHKDKVFNLIVVPPTLVQNWINEARKFFPLDSVSIYQLGTKSVCSDVNIVVASFNQVLGGVNKSFFYLVIDEAHAIKNPESKLFLSVKTICAQRKIALTGTPIQNNVMEFWTIFDFLMPGFLGDKSEFNRKYHKKISTTLKNLNLNDKVQESIFQTSLAEIRKRIKPFVLRRLKTEVLKELPDKIIQDYICVLTPAQEDIYAFYEKQLNLKQLKESETEMLNTVTLTHTLRKICNGLANFSADELPVKVVNHNEIEKNAKLLSLRDIFVTIDFINSMKRENKVLIFSQFSKCLLILADFIKAEFPHLKFVTMTKEMSSEARVKLADDFNSKAGIDVMLLTTSIGGLGLTLTGANIVIMYDHDWNPMKDLQAMDRAHRIGQHKVVEVFRLICRDTIEERLISLQKFKQIIGEQVVKANDVSDKNINVESFMGALEEFGKDKGHEEKEVVDEFEYDRDVEGLVKLL